MARRKRMVYDPPGSRKRRRRTDTSYGRQNFLSRRMFIAKSGVIAVFGALAARLGYLQLVKGDDYRLQAEQNVYKEEVLPAPRGLIFDRLGRPLAQNRRSWEVRVIKADLPEDETEQRRVLDMLISALQTEDVLTIQPSAVPSGSRDTVFARLARMLGFDEEDTRKEIARWIELSGDSLVLVSPLSIDDAAYFRAHSADLPGVLVMNEIDYLVGNVWAPRRPVTIKSDVPRDVALKLKANSMYMPGVEVDDTALSREYPGDEVMSHVIGYVRTIDSASLDDLRNRDENNERIYDQNDIIGREGLEQALESRLRGTRGTQVVEVDATGVVMRTVPDSVVEPVSGTSVRLSIDLELQQAVGKAIEKAVDLAFAGKERVNTERGQEGKRLWQLPNAGTAVAYDPRTGEVLAMVSYPYYDNQLFITGISARKWGEYINPTRGKAFLNRTVHELYPPGSTFKIFLAASALDHEAVIPTDTHSCRGAIRVPNTWDLNEGLTMACWVGWNGREHGSLDLYGAIEQSCDVYFYNVAQEYEKETDAFDPIYYWDWNLQAGELISNTKHTFEGLGIDLLAEDMQKRFWFGRETGIEILDEAIGLFPDRAWKQDAIGEGWAVGDTLNVSIGQGETKVTPLQLTMNTAALANGGTFLRPHLVRESTREDGTWVKTQVEEMGILDIAPEHIEVVVEGMRRVVHEEMGTAHHSTVNDERVTKWPLTNPEGEEEIIIAGKTGTAEFGQQDDLGARD
ncbi:MAG TPA: penicillin-binding transpeptidase domain-containing protein, partial [Thermomicrobiales bacterium]|nr:penicillin-binding transpeptidase domain-containing protein [Thermomicrobiales bacterium]